MALLTVKIKADRTDDVPLAGYVVYLRDDVTEDYIDFSDDAFKDFGSLVTPTLALSEDPNHLGLWSFSYGLVAGFTGTLEIIIHKTHDDTEMIEFLEVGIDNDVPLLDLAKTVAYFGTHTGGFENLKVLDGNGTPVEGATVRVYAIEDFNANNLSKWVGATTTDKRGYWLAPVPVTTGKTYMIHVFKPLSYGPTVVQLSA